MTQAAHTPRHLPAATTSMWDRRAARPEAPSTQLPAQTLADASTTLRFVQPQFAVERARASAWDNARKPALESSERTTGMSALPARIAAELRARRGEV